LDAQFEHVHQTKLSRNKPKLSEAIRKKPKICDKDDFEYTLTKLGAL